MNIRILRAIEAAMNKNEFCSWLSINRLEHGYSEQNLADKLRCTKQTVSNHCTGRSKPSFVYVVAYCALFGNKDDPEEIWKLVNEEEAQ